MERRLGKDDEPGWFRLPFAGYYPHFTCPNGTSGFVNVTNLSEFVQLLSF